MERIEDELKVVFVEEPLGVTSFLGGDHAVGVGVVGLDADVQRVRVVNQTDDRPLRRGVAL